jgi:uncharacterized protein involved in outer membrane biogenesis
VSLPPKFRKALRWLIAVLAVLLALIAAAIFFRDPILKRAAARAIERNTGMRVEIASFKTGLRHPAITMQGVKLFNYPEFGGALMCDVPDLLVEFDPDDYAQGRLHFKQLRLHVAELNVVHDTNGLWNLEKVEKEMTDRNAERERRRQPKLQFGGIDELHLTVGRVTYVDKQRPHKSRDFPVNIRDEVVKNLRTEEDLQDWIGDFIFKIILQEASLPPSAKKKRKPVQTLKDALEGQPPP